MTTIIKSLIRREVENLSPVNWGEYKDDTIRLYWGENLIDLPQKMLEKIFSGIQSINRYPDPNQTKLRNALSNYNETPAKQIIVGNGSDALIELLAKTFIEKGDEAIIPQPSFITYSNVVKLLGGRVVNIDLDDKFCLDINQLIRKISGKTKIIFIANPNNPTGNYLANIEDVEKILQSFKGIVVIDECYYETGGLTVKSLLDRYENLIILRSFSKVFALGGLRIGYALSSEEIIRWLSTVQKIPQPFEVNALAQIGAIESLKWKDVILEKFKNNKQDFVDKLKEIPFVDIVDTKTTFILLDLKKTGIKAKSLVNRLEKRNILTKDCSVFPNFSEYILYIGIPKNSEVDLVVRAIKEAIS